MQHVADVGSTKGVDALIVVTHHAYVRVVAGEQLDNLLLGVVGVLVLIDEDITETFSVFLADVGVLREQQVGVEQQVVEVHGVGSLEPLLIGHEYLVQLSHVPVGIIVHGTLVGSIFLSTSQSVLCP